MAAFPRDGVDLEAPIPGVPGLQAVEHPAASRGEPCALEGLPAGVGVVIEGDLLRGHGGAYGEAVLAEDVTVVLAFDDGSTASIGYSSGGHGGGSKERLEIMGRGHTIVIDDFRELTIDGTRSKHPQDKGHGAQFERWKSVLGGTSPGVTGEMVDSMRLTIQAASSLTGHGPA